MKTEKKKVSELVSAALDAAGVSAEEVLVNAYLQAHVRVEFLNAEIGKSDFIDALNAQLFVERKGDLARFTGAPKPSPGPWVQYCVSGSPSRLAEIQAVMDSWIWQIKRKIANRPIPRPIMPIFVSAAQGCGKSMLVRKHILGSFRKWMRCDADLSQLNSVNDRRTIAEHYVAFFDEMAGAKKADCAHLKSFVTGEDVDGRQMYGSTNIKTRQLASLIATSNHPVKDLIPDPTGMSRFYEIVVDPRVMDANRDNRDRYDWAAWIDSIDVDADDPRAPFKEAVAAVQKTMKNDTVSEWVDECAAIVSSLRSAVWDSYRDFCISGEYRDRLGKKTFFAELRKRGWQESKDAVGLVHLIPPKNGEEINLDVEQEPLQPLPPPKAVPRTETPVSAKSAFQRMSGYPGIGEDESVAQPSSSIKMEFADDDSW